MIALVVTSTIQKLIANAMIPEAMENVIFPKAVFPPGVIIDFVLNKIFGSNPKKWGVNAPFFVLLLVESPPLKEFRVWSVREEIRRGELFYSAFLRVPG